MRGASALQTVLEEPPYRPLIVFVVWEPVIATDVGPPTSGTLARLRDLRVRQYWDPHRSLSRQIVRSVRKAPERYGLVDEMAEDTVVWDVVALFPEGALWGEDIPVPTFFHTPVEEAMGGLREALAPARGNPPAME